MQYNYVLLNEGFYRWLETNHLPIQSQLLFLKLIHLFNLSGWSEWLVVDNQRMMALVQTKREQTVIEWRDKLLEKGLLFYIKGKKESPNKYKLNDGLPFINEAKSVVKDEVNTVVKSVVNTAVNTVNIDKQNKTKQNIPPKVTNVTSSPKGGKVDALFEKFWSVYPRKMAKQKAMDSWRKIPKIEETLDKILAGVEKWAKTEQWQKDNGQFIPLPSTFLNQKRWEDEIPEGAKNHGRNQQYPAKKLCFEYPE